MLVTANTMDDKREREKRERKSGRERKGGTIREREMESRRVIKIVCVGD